MRAADLFEAAPLVSLDSMCQYQPTTGRSLTDCPMEEKADVGWDSQSRRDHTGLPAALDRGRRPTSRPAYYLTRVKVAPASA